MTAITYEQVRAQLAEIIAEKPPGYTYTRQGASLTCLYVHGGYAGPLDASLGMPPDPLVPGCIVAHWLHRYHGVSLEMLATMEGIAGPNLVIRLIATGVLPHDLLNDDSSLQMLKFLQEVQRIQDADLSWSFAVEAAHEVVTSPPWSFMLAPSWRPDYGEPVPQPASARG